MARYTASIVLLLCMVLPMVSVAATNNIVVVADATQPVHEEFVETFRSQLGSNVVVTVLKDIKDSSAFSGADAVITLGFRAAQDIYQYQLNIPIVNCLVSKADMHRLKRGKDAEHSMALYLEQPPARTLLLIQKALNGKRNITVAIGPSSSELWQDVAHACEKESMHCTPVMVRESAGIEAALRAAEKSEKILLLLPDASVVNSVTAKNLILSAYRRKIALVGYSRALVKAGVLMAVHSTPEQLGKDAAETVNSILRNEIPVSQLSDRYPQRYSVAVNYQLARALNLHLGAEKILLNEIMKAEHND